MIGANCLPADLLERLGAAVPGFGNEAPRIRFAHAAMLWTGAFGKRRQHLRVPGAIWATRDELRKTFGRTGFQRSNDRLSLFEVHPWNFHAGETKAYRPTPLAREVVDVYLADRKATTSLVRMHGDAIRQVSPGDVASAVASLSATGSPIKPWTGAEALADVSVNTKALRSVATLSSMAVEELGGGYDFFGLVGPEHGGRLELAGEACAKVLRMSDTDLLPMGHMPTKYQQSAAGRLYALGINLQNAPSIIKQAALKGQWEYDIAAAHFAIVLQLAAGRGVPCPAIAAYVADKTRVRRRIAYQAKVSVDMAKRALLSVLYGARISVSPKTAIASMLGESWLQDLIFPSGAPAADQLMADRQRIMAGLGSGARLEDLANPMLADGRTFVLRQRLVAALGGTAARHLFDSPDFTAIAGEVEAARKAIVSGATAKANRMGSVINACGLPISKEATPEKILAHLTQGVEAAALRSVVARAAGSLTLLQHDGFASADRLDKAALECAIQAATGFELQLEEERIEGDLFDWARGF